MNDEETMVRTALGRTAVTGEPETAAIDAVFTRAGRIRARRRMGAGFLAVSAIAGVSTLLALGQGGGGGAVAPVEVKVPVASAAPTLKGLTEPGAVVANLIRLMPASATTSSPYAEKGFGEIVVSDPAGSTKVIVNIQPLFFEDGAKPGPSEVDAGLFDCGTRAVASGHSCQARALPDGTRIVVVMGTSGGITFRQVDALVAGRLRVVAGEWNAVDAKRGPVTRSEPLLSVEQLEALVLDPSWRG